MFWKILLNVQISLRYLYMKKRERKILTKYFRRLRILFIERWSKLTTTILSWVWIPKTHLSSSNIISKRPIVLYPKAASSTQRSKSLKTYKSKVSSSTRTWSTKSWSLVSKSWKRIWRSALLTFLLLNGHQCSSVWRKSTVTWKPSKSSTYSTRWTMTMSKIIRDIARRLSRYLIILRCACCLLIFMSLTRGPENWRIIQRLLSWSRNSANCHSKSKRIKKRQKFPIPLALQQMRIEKIRRLSSLENKISKRRLKISQSEGIRRWPTSKEHLYPDPL